MTTTTEQDPAVSQDLQQVMINTVRTLSIDAVQKANSGHPGAPLGMAPAGYTLFSKVMRFNPKDPDWINRDRFILSAGHASMLLYSLLYLTGYDLSLDDIKNFRQWGSKTPGHPEYERTPGVEATTGPLGQGFANGVGMAIAEAYLRSYFNRPGYDLIDHYIYAIVSDGDLQEGVASEAASLAGHLKLGKLIYLYDRNHIQLSGPTSTSFTEDVLERFRAYGWHTDEVKDGNDTGAILSAVQAAQGVTDKPSLIAVNTIIGYGSPEQNTFKVHGEPLGVEGVRETKKALGWPEDKDFYVPQEALDEFRKAVPRGEQAQQEWHDLFGQWRQEFPDLAQQWDRANAGQLMDGWDTDLPTYKPEDGGVATREASGAAMNAIAAYVPTFIGGDADLAPSTKTQLKPYGDFEPGHYDGRNIHFGVREHAMGSIVNGIVLNGMTWAYGATFFVFSDYQRPSVRLASIMEIPTIFVYTHDSVLLGEDGPTHQPIEHLMSLRAMPNLYVIRPADANESVEAWAWAMQNRHNPMAMVFSRQKVPVLDRSGAQDDLSKGAYVLREASGGKPDVILLGTGSEVALCVGAAEDLEISGVAARVVSYPSWEIFEQQPEEYRNRVLPPDVTARVSVEAGATLGWCRWIGDKGVSVGIDHFGESAPAAENAKHMGLTVENVVRAADRAMGRGE
jgi:transketolase